jgi:Holliday junction DNA helicase RuvB
MTVEAVRDVSAGALEGEAKLEQSLRPASFDEYVGQEKIVDNVKVYARAARARGDALDHVLLSGPPGLGKTSMAHILARELGVTLHVTSGPALVKKGDLAGLLTALQARDILFIDEIHRLSPAVEEALYPAMEDYRLDVVLGAGIGAQTMEMKLERFTLIGATTRTGLLAAPLRDRFPIQERLDYYATPELTEIATRAARKLALPVEAAAVVELAARARGTPRIAIRLLQRARDFAQVEGDGRLTSAVVETTLRRLDVDARGLDAMDRRILATVIDTFGGGPVGIDSVAASVGEEPGTIEDVYEPFLVREGFLARTPRGRMALEAAYRHLGRIPGRDRTGGGQGNLL